MTCWPFWLKGSKFQGQRRIFYLLSWTKFFSKKCPKVTFRLEKKFLTHNLWLFCFWDPLKMVFLIVPDGPDQTWFQIVLGCHVQILNKKSGLKIFKKTFESHNLGWEVGWSFWCWFKGWSRYQSDPFDSKNNHGSQLHNQTDDVITWPTNDVTNDQ